MKDRVVFYSKHDMSLGWQYDRIADLIKEKDKWPEYEDIEDVIELYHLMLVIETGLHPNTLSDAEWKKYQEAASGVKRLVAIRFRRVTNDTIEEELEKIDISYKESFWEILFAFGGTDRIDDKTVEGLLNTGKTNILHFLRNKKAVQTYGEVVKRYLQNNLSYAREMITEYLEKREGNYEHYFFPQELTKEDKVTIIDRYIDSPEVGINDLKLLSTSQGNEQLPITPKMRLKAKQKYKEKGEQLSNTGVSFSYGIRITFVKQQEPLMMRREGRDFHFFYDVDWILENLDYPTLLNNFIYLFEFVDYQYRWQHISKVNMLGIFERSMGSRGKREYVTGELFFSMEMKAQCQLYSYIIFLEENGVYIENLIKWFFETYLEEEFNAKGFVYHSSTRNSTLLEKCRNMAIEIDSVLKQYRLYCEDKVVDRDLFEISTEHMLIANVPSQIEDKYAYPVDENVSIIMRLLFSDQSNMFYHEGKGESKSAYEALLKNTIKYDELKPYQRSEVDYLIEKKILWLDDDNNIAFSSRLLFVLYDLYKNEFLCLKYNRGFETETEFLLNNKFIEIKSSLLAIPEQNYIDYIFNNAKYDNSKDLRNKYAHGTQTLDENMMRMDYLTMIRMMILIILKINEEFCLKDDMQDNRNAE